MSVDPANSRETVVANTAMKDSPVIKAMLAKMEQRFDGGWVSHSVNMVDNFFNRRKYKPEDPPPCDQCLVLPYGALFPFSWNRKDLCCDYCTLFRGVIFDNLFCVICLGTPLI